MNRMKGLKAGVCTIPVMVIISYNWLLELGCSVSSNLLYVSNRYMYLNSDLLLISIMNKLLSKLEGSTTVVLHEKLWFKDRHHFGVQKY